MIPEPSARAERGGQVVLDIPHRHSTGASGLVIHTHPARPGRRWPLALPRRGVKVPTRSRGTTGLKGPHPDESTVLDVVPFLALPRAWVVGSPLS